MNPDTAVAESIRYSIEKNGFPGRPVKLPFRPIFESCKRHGTPLIDVLSGLREQGVVGTVTGDHILFQTPAQREAAAAAPNPASRDTGPNPLAWLGGFPGGLDRLRQLAAQGLSQLSPEQIRELKRRVEAMSPEDKARFLAFYRDMFQGFKSP